MMRRTRGSTGAMSCAPLVSSSTVKPASHSAVMSGEGFFCNNGSPPVNSTRGRRNGVPAAGVWRKGPPVPSTRARISVNGHPLPLREGISRVAIGTAQIAGRQPDENARQPRKGALALQAQVDFIDDQCFGHPRSVTPSRKKKMPVMRGGGAPAPERPSVTGLNRRLGLKGSLVDHGFAGLAAPGRPPLRPSARALPGQPNRPGRRPRAFLLHFLQFMEILFGPWKH